MDAGHRKAVSYVRWLSDREVVSASTDSTLRLWDIHSARESRTFRGHVNEKNFVGLAADSEFIACGSETNEVRPWSLLCCSLLALACVGRLICTRWLEGVFCVSLQLKLDIAAVACEAAAQDVCSCFSFAKTCDTCPLHV